jgi:hypothetical protein
MPAVCTAAYAPAAVTTFAPGVADPTEQVRDVRVVGLVAFGFALASSALDLGVLCPLRRLTGLPCPLCGLTTGIAALARGDVVGAVHANPLAPLALAFLALAWSPWGPAAVSATRRHPTALAVVLGLVWTAHLAGLTGP